MDNFGKTARSYSLILAIALSGALTACSKGDAEEKKEETYAIPVETAIVTTGDVGSFYSTTATLEAPEEAEVVTRVAGLIEQLHTEEGMQVKKGQLLATIDSRRQLYQYQQSEAEVKVIEQELERLNKMTNKQFISADSISKLQYNLQAATAQRDLAKLQLTESEVRSPIDGVIAKRFVKAGNMIKEFEPLFHVVRQDELHAIVHLPEQQLSNLKIDQQASVSSTLNPDYRASANVIRISPVVDATSGTFKVTLLLPNADNQFKSGMFTRTELQYDTHQQVTVVPYNALVNQDNNYAIYVIDNGKANQKDVTIGYQQDGLVEILSGVNLGEQIVIRGQHNLKDQSDVEVINSAEVAAIQQPVSK
ncbi:efflux RND transporter periplasmic adaptor subunit [Parashewanella spongiae]|uniref:Efflux RND transporter periplasmic adaptor subunit n=1 Tax=Parashewanella spongiae TaxID=342950 RepID=A0A3A6UGX9_9GAMM|nr:efflux RND transporter periplasmic adaptor subunit [Parashewanella spongiae]MCL1077585.1 efflux RND transporter periplasmic adaptor subunit [Parashewanella spongiae]RJY18209.1 efflux RND transporter periplasmic adaptor subunit [Parashewanella spongiae]